MKDLINAIKAFLEADITSLDITAKIVQKGLPESFQLVPFNNFPYIALGDGGERAEPTESMDAENRFYAVFIVFAAFSTNRETALDSVLDLSNQVKASIEKSTNRQKDGHVWGLTIVPFDWEDEKGFYMGRSVTIEYRELETTYQEY